MSKSLFSTEQKLAILQEIENGQLGIMAAATKYHTTKTTLAKWRRRYEVYGYEGLDVRAGNRSYSTELKLQAVKDYLSGEMSQYDIIDKYKIASRTQLADWVKKYNGHSSLNAYKGKQKL